MKVLFFSNHAGGMINFRREVLQAMLTAGHEVHVCVPYNAYVTDLVQMGCIYEPCEFDRHGTDPFDELRVIGRYRQILKTVAPDVVFTYTIKSNIYGGMVCARKNIPYVTNISGFGMAIENPGPMRKIALILYRWALRRARMVFFQNTGNRDFMLKHHIVKGAHDMLPGSGVNLAVHSYQSYPSSDSEIILLFAGRIMRDKGIEELLAAAKRLHGKYGSVRFVVVGRYEDNYRTKMAELNAEKYMEFVGEQKNINEWYAKAHALVNPTYHEGMSNVCLEAAACGRPLLASDIDGCRETFDEGVSGFGFKPRDVDSLCEALERFIALPHDKKEEMGRAGRAKMKREFDRDIVVEKYIKIVHEIEGR